MLRFNHPIVKSHVGIEYLPRTTTTWRRPSLPMSRCMASSTRPGRRSPLGASATRSRSCAGWRRRRSRSWEKTGMTLMLLGAESTYSNCQCGFLRHSSNNWYILCTYKYDITELLSISTSGDILSMQMTNYPTELKRPQSPAVACCTGWLIIFTYGFSWHQKKMSIIVELLILKRNF